MSQLTISPAQTNDTDTIRRLLIDARLPSEDFAKHIHFFLVAEQDSTVVGVVGLEVHGDAGLLRSLVVDGAYRGHGLGTQLCNRLCDSAQAAHIKTLYLLTTTASGFFPKLGFVETQRSAAPPAIQASEEFSSICPSTAVCMTKAL